MYTRSLPPLSSLPPHILIQPGTPTKIIQQHIQSGTSRSGVGDEPTAIYNEGRQAGGELGKCYEAGSSARLAWLTGITTGLLEEQSGDVIHLILILVFTILPSRLLDEQFLRKVLIVDIIVELVATFVADPVHVIRVMSAAMCTQPRVRERVDVLVGASCHIRRRAADHEPDADEVGRLGRAGLDIITALFDWQRDGGARTMPLWDMRPEDGYNADEPFSADFCLTTKRQRPALWTIRVRPLRALS